MLYYIYIGNNKTVIDHLNTITDGMFVSVSSVNKAVKIINGIRERYNTSILYEQTNTEKDCRHLLSSQKVSARIHYPHYRKVTDRTPQSLPAGWRQQHPAITGR